VIVRIATADFELAGTPIPTGPVDITGIVLHYGDGGALTSGYRLVPRSPADIVPAQTPEVPHLTITRVNDTVVLSWPAFRPPPAPPGSRSRSSSSRDSTTRACP
jgi:hypothetical protein